MYDFVIAALPWIAMGITVALVLANESNKKRGKYYSNKRTDNIADEETANENGEKNYITYGMLFGIAIGLSLSDKFGTITLTYGICFGMLIGTFGGVLFKKK